LRDAVPSREESAGRPAAARELHSPVTPGAGEMRGHGTEFLPSAEGRFTSGLTPVDRRRRCKFAGWFAKQPPECPLRCGFESELPTPDPSGSVTVRSRLEP